MGLKWRVLRRDLCGGLSRSGAGHNIERLMVWRPHSEKDFLKIRKCDNLFFANVQRHSQAKRQAVRPSASRLSNGRRKPPLFGTGAETRRPKGLSRTRFARRRRRSLGRSKNEPFFERPITILDNPFGRRTWAPVPSNGGPWRWRYFRGSPTVEIENLTLMASFAAISENNSQRI
jgi:hypothetical protein